MSAKRDRIWVGLLRFGHGGVADQPPPASILGTFWFAVRAVATLFMGLALLGAGCALVDHAPRILAETRSPMVARVMLLLGADSTRALHWHAYLGNDDIVDVLLDHDADVDHTDIKDERPPLFDAIDGGHASTVEMLIARGADATRREYDTRETPCEYAERLQKTEVVAVLRRRGLCGPERPRSAVRELDEAVPEPGAGERPARARGADLPLACEAAE